MLMKTTKLDEATERATKLFMQRITRQYDTAGGILFGSRARQTHRADSDADVAFDVLLETGINISPLPVWLDEWEHPETYSNPNLLKNIANERVRL